MRWKAHFFLKPDTSTSSRDTYGFKSTKNPPPIDELKEFEDDMLKMVQSTRFKQVNDPFLNKLNDDTKRIKQEPKLLIAADKTTNWNRQNTTTCWNKTSQSPTKELILIPYEISIKKTRKSLRSWESMTE